MVEFYRHDYPKSRKEHTCEYCNEKIGVGSIYSYETGMYDGNFFVRKLCMCCDRMMEKFHIWNDFDEFTWDTVDDFLRDSYCHDCDLFDECNNYKTCTKIRNLISEKGDKKE